MGSDFTVHYSRRARKQWRCDHCRETIEAGALYEDCRGAWEGYFYQWRRHPECTFAVTIAYELHRTSVGNADEAGEMNAGRGEAYDTMEEERVTCVQACVRTDRARAITLARRCGDMIELEKLLDY